MDVYRDDCDGGQRRQFHVGNRVQVAESWFAEAIRGAVGTIIEPPSNAPEPASGVYWIEFDELQGGNIDSAEVEGTFLIRR